MSFNSICKKIKSVEIQGAENIALAGLKAYSLKPTKASIKKLISLRPTEPALVNALKYAEKFSIKKAQAHFKESKEKIAKLGAKKIHGLVFTHCHSSTVISILKKAKQQRKKFQVFNTETRPLYQGHITAKELAKAKIPVTTIIEAAANSAIEHSSLVLLGADAIICNIKTNKVKGIINKIGSAMYAELAYYDKTPVYIATNSWKFSPKPVKIEERNYNEVWRNAPEHIKIQNPAFEKIPPKYLTAVISELGILTPHNFIKKVKKVYPWITKR